MAETDARPRRRGALLRVALVLAAAVGITVLAVRAFEVGVLTGLYAAGGVLVVYTVPAVIFDWPRVSLSDLGDFLMAIVEAIGSFFASLFDW